jgi:hypothetical protein
MAPSLSIREPAVPRSPSADDVSATTLRASRGKAALLSLARRLDSAGASLTLQAPGAGSLRIGADPDRCVVLFHGESALAPLVAGDHLALAEAYLRGDFTLGRFMKEHLWPGPTGYVNPYGLVEALVRAGFNVHEMRDDTRSYELTTRCWGDLLEAQRKDLAAHFGEQAVRAFLLFLRGSTIFLASNRTQAYRVVLGLEPAPLAPS